MNTPPPQPTSDLATFLEAQRAALSAFLRVHASALVRRHESVSDLTQTVFRALLAEGQRFELRSPEALRGWLFRTALNMLKDRHRYYSRQARNPTRERPLAGLSAELREDVLLDAHRTVFTPSRDAAAREQLRRLEQAMASLTEEQRVAISLQRIAGLSLAEVGTCMGRSPDGVRMLVRRGLVQLSALLGE